MNLENIKNWLVDRFNEKSTYQGIFAALTVVFGVIVPPELAGGIIMAGVGLIGAVDVWTREEAYKVLRGAFMIAGAAGAVIFPELQAEIIKFGILVLAATGVIGKETKTVSKTTG